MDLVNELDVTIVVLGGRDVVCTVVVVGAYIDKCDISCWVGSKVPIWYVC